MAAIVCGRIPAFHLELRKIHQSLKYLTRHKSFSANSGPTFGFLFDIDGVIVRGKNVIPRVPEAFRRLVDSEGKFIVPTVFVTNAGNALRHVKAQQLSDWLGIKVNEDKVVMAHTPLKIFYEYHNKCVLVSGQGPIEEISQRLGFKKFVTIDDVRNSFPLLDAVDFKRRMAATGKGDPTFPRVEAVVLYGEPVRWETALQLIIDVLMTDGHLSKPPQRLNYPHVPILACNMDLQWMAEASIPRFGHGAFLLCLEELYKKITGKDLIYTALVGKPSELTYLYAHQLILDQAREIGIAHELKRLYAIGDNINTDIFGANLYNQCLSGQQRVELQNSSGGSAIELTSSDNNINACYSVLVKTGVFTNELSDSALDHSPRDFVNLGKDLRQPSFTISNVAEAIDMIFKKEGYH